MVTASPLPSAVVVGLAERPPCRPRLGEGFARREATLVNCRDVSEHCRPLGGRRGAVVRHWRQCPGPRARPRRPKLGTVNFATSCSAAAQPHSIMRSPCCTRSSSARRSRDSTRRSRRIPSCAMAHWGIAISRWSNPFGRRIRPPAQLQQGLEAVDARARRSGRRPSASARTSKPSRTVLRARDARSACARARVPRSDGGRWRPRTRRPRGVDLLGPVVDGVARCRPTRPTRIS